MAQGREKVDILPHNIEVEQSVLGSLMLNPAAVEQVARIIKPSDFYRPAHGEIFDAICSLAARDEPVDLITVQEELRRKGKLSEIGGTEYLMTLLSVVPSAARVIHYASIIRDLSIERKQISVCTQIVEALRNNSTAEASEKIKELDELSKLKSDDGVIPHLTFSEALQSDDVSITWIVDKLIPKKGITMITGDSGVGKTWFALQLAISACIGAPFLDEFTASALAALYIDAEAGEILLKRRAKEIWNAITSDVPEIGEYYKDNENKISLRLSYQEIDLMNTEFVDRLLRDIELTGTELVIIDPFNRVFTGKENDAGDVAKFFNNIKRIRDATGCTFIFIHHARKRSFDAPNDAGQMLRGSTAIRAALDSHIFIRGIDNNIIRVEHDKSRYAVPVEPFMAELVGIGEGVMIKYKGDKDAIEAGKRELAKRRIIEIIADAGGSAYRQYLIDSINATEADIAESTIARAIKELVDDGSIIRLKSDRKTKYALPINGELKGLDDE